MVDQEIVYRKATKDDAAFISLATLHAERAHNGYGIWDLLYHTDSSNLLKNCKDPSNSYMSIDYTHSKALECIQEIVMNDFKSHLYYENFILATVYDDRSSTYQPVATCSGYITPCKSLSYSIDRLTKISPHKLNWGQCKMDSNADLINFLFNSWPIDLDVDGSYMIETVYTDAKFRGRKISRKLIEMCLEKGRKEGCNRFIIIVAFGNDVAIGLYNSFGFKELPVSYSSQEMMDRMGVPGYHLLELKE